MDRNSVRVKRLQTQTLSIDLDRPIIVDVENGVHMFTVWSDDDGVHFSADGKETTAKIIEIQAANAIEIKEEAQPI